MGAERRRHETLRALAAAALAAAAVFGAWLAAERLWLPEASAPLRERLHPVRGAITAALALVATAWLLHRARRRAHRRLEREVRDARALRERIVDSVRDGILLWHPDGRLAFLSPPAERMLGVRAADVLGRPVQALLTPVGAPAGAAGERPAPPLGRATRVEMLRGDGSSLPAELVASAVEPEGLVVGVLRDTRDQDMAREERLRSESLRMLIDGLPDAVIVHRDERLLYANRSFLERLGYESPDEVLGRSLRHLLHPDGVPRVMRRLEELRRTGKALPPDEERFRTRAGEPVVLEVAKVPVTFDGEPAVVAIGRDLTERRLAEERFRLAVESSPSGMVMVDPQGSIVMASRAALELFDYGESELVGAPIETLVPERLRHHHPALREGFLEAPRRRPMGSGRELFGLRRDGAEIPVEIGLNPIETAEGTFVLASVVDIRERRRAEGLLAATDRMSAVGTLAAGVAHGINNPLAFVKGNLTYGRDELGDLVATLPAGRVRETLEDLRAVLQESEEGAERIRDIVADLLTFARKENSEPGHADVREVLDSVVQMARNEIRHRARVEKRYGAVPPVAASTSHLAHAFANLVLNAAQALPEGEAERHVIGLTTSTDARGRVVVEIRDTGPGIPEAVRSRIFEPFITTKPTGMGTGLGLSVTHGIVTGLGGTIEVESEPGRGSCFRLTLPAAPQGAERTPPREAASTPPAARRLRVLVVDDEPAVRSMMVRVLRRHHDVEAVASGREALERIAGGTRYDAILSDLLMPDVTGMQLSQGISELDPDQARRIGFLTGGAFTDAARRFLDETRSPVLDKPVDRDRLLDLLRELAERGEGAERM